MKKIWIIGNGIYAGMLLEYLRADAIIEQTYQICGFVVDQNYIQEDQFKGLPVIPFEKLAAYDRQDTVLLLGIGYRHMADYREMLYCRCKEMGFTFLNYIHPTAVVHPFARLGEGNVFLENVIVEAGCEIGAGNLFYGSAVLGHDSVMGDYNTMSIGAVTAGCVTISSHCFLGVRSAIKDHVVLADYVLVGATAYAYKDVPAYHVVHSPRCEITGEKKSTELI